MNIYIIYMSHPRDESSVPSAPIQGARRLVVRGKESVGRAPRRRRFRRQGTRGGVAPLDGRLKQGFDSLGVDRHSRASGRGCLPPWRNQIANSLNGARRIPGNGRGPGEVAVLALAPRARRGSPDRAVSLTEGLRPRAGLGDLRSARWQGQENLLQRVHCRLGISGSYFPSRSYIAYSDREHSQSREKNSVRRARTGRSRSPTTGRLTITIDRTLASDPKELKTMLTPMTYPRHRETPPMGGVFDITVVTALLCSRDSCSRSGKSDSFSQSLESLTRCNRLRLAQKAGFNRLQTCVVASRAFEIRGTRSRVSLRGAGWGCLMRRSENTTRT
jgi:hypothetical protein